MEAISVTVRAQESLHERIEMEASTTMRQEEVTSTVFQTHAEQSCDFVQYIPGFVSNETSRGLLEFSTRFSQVHGYIAVAVCLFGVLANSANILVLTRKNMASSTNTLLLWLAVADLLTMLEYLPFALHFYVMDPGDPSRPPFSSLHFYWICFLLFHASFSIVCHTVAIWLTIALAIFRYIYICMPTSGVYYCSQRRARGVVLAVVLLTLVICIPNCAVNSYDTFLLETFNSNQTNAIPTLGSATNPNNQSIESLTRAPPSITVYYYPTIRQKTPADELLVQGNNWLQAVLIKLVPCFMLTTLTLLLIHALHKAYRKRLKLKSQGRKAESDKTGEHNRITRMLLAIVVLFTLTELPQGILTLMNIFVTCFTNVVYFKLGDLLDLMALTNNAVNFVLYCTMSTQFRVTFAAIFCPRETMRPKWLRLRLVSSRNVDSNSFEVSEVSRTPRGNRNGFMSRSLEFTDTDVISKVMDDQMVTCDSTGSLEKIALTMDSNNINNDLDTSPKSSFV